MQDNEAYAIKFDGGPAVTAGTVSKKVKKVLHMGCRVQISGQLIKTRFFSPACQQYK